LGNSLWKIISHVPQLKDFYVRNEVVIREQEEEIKIQLREVDFTALRSPDYLTGSS